MADQIQNEKSTIVGEDGELIQSDMTVDPTAYAEYVTTHVRRDPLLFRMREHIKDWGCAYILFMAGAVIVFFLISALMEMFMSARRVEDLGFLVGSIEVFIVIAFFVIRHDRRR